jgi:Na+/citrate or Na+/malate symporter
MTQKDTSAATPVEEKKTSFWSTKISGVSLPIYLIMVVVLIVAMALGKLPTNMIGPIAILVILGTYSILSATKSLSLKVILAAVLFLRSLLLPQSQRSESYLTQW